MHRRRHSPLAIVSLQLFLVSVLGASDLTGTWIGTIPKQGRAGDKDVAFRFVQEGESLAGKAYNDSGSSDPIISGTVAAGSVSFDVEAMEQAGNQVNVVLYRFRGSVADSRVELTRERAAARDAASGADVPVRRPWDSDEEDRSRRFRSFRLERLTR